jgi:hypothetical protein
MAHVKFIFSFHVALSYQKEKKEKLRTVNGIVRIFQIEKTFSCNHY